MLKRETLPINDIYVPTKRRATLKPEHVLEIAESMLDKGQETPILVRLDGARYVLVEGRRCISNVPPLCGRSVVVNDPGTKPCQNDIAESARLQVVRRDLP